jgi:hypothetical protein
MGFYIRNFQTIFVTDAIYGRPIVASRHLSRTAYPTYPNIYLSRSDLIEFAHPTEQRKVDTHGAGIAAREAVLHHSS